MDIVFLLKRLIIQDIIKKKNCFNTNIQCCKLPITCYEPNCMLGHYVDYEHRMIINAIIKIKSDIEAEAIYCRQFVTKKCDIDSYMIVPKNTKLQDTIKNNLNIEIIKTQLISELQKQQEKHINTTKKLNKTLFDIDQSLFEKQEISAQLDKLKNQYRYLISTIHQR